MRNYNDDFDNEAVPAEPEVQQTPIRLSRTGITETKLMGFDDNDQPVYRITTRTVTDRLGIKKNGRYSTLYHATNSEEDCTTVEKVVYDHRRGVTVETSTKTYNDKDVKASLARLQDRIK